MEMSVLMDSAMLMEVVWTLIMASLVSAMKDMKATDLTAQVSVMIGRGHVESTMTQCHESHKVWLDPDE